MTTATRTPEHDITNARKKTGCLSCLRVVVSFLFTGIALGLMPAPLAAQTPAAPAAGSTNVEVDPIRCWWRTSTGAIRIGENFELTLTCARLDTDAVEVVPDETRLGAAVVQMAPFEIVGGSHPADLRSGARTFFQYHYTLRLINPDYFGKDVRLPDIVIHYRINSRVDTSAAVQGRDLVYLLPPQVLRVQSLVPMGAGDIRDAQGEDFGVAETLRFRAGALEIAGLTAMALGALVVLLVLVRLARRAGGRSRTSLPTVSDAAIFGAAARELGAVQRAREQQGWDAGLLDRALAATRVLASGALDRPVSQRVSADAEPGEGRLVVKKPLGGKAFVVSSSLTADDLARAQRRGPSRSMVADALAGLEQALQTFGNAQYGRGGAADQAALDSALQQAVTAAGRVKGSHTWLHGWVRQWRARPQAAESRA